MNRLHTLLLLLILLGCARHQNGISGSPPPDSTATIHPSVEATPSVLLRHAVRLEIRGQKTPQTFDGILGFDTTYHTVRAVALGGFGLKLFDLTITPDTAQTHMLHPALVRIPGIVDHITFCIRRIWMDYQPSETGTTPQKSDCYVQLDTCRGVMLEHEWSGNRRIRTKALGPGECWTIQFLDHNPLTNEPRHIVFLDGNDRYRLDIRTVTR